MSEESRSRLYAWLCEQTDEPLAEYVMSCLAQAPLPDLVTKDYLSAALAGLATTEQVQSGFDALAAQREADRGNSVRQFRWLIATFVALAGVLVAAMYGVAAIA